MQNLMHSVFFSKSNRKWLKKGLKLRQSGKTLVGFAWKLRVKIIIIIILKDVRKQPK